MAANEYFKVAASNIRRAIDVKRTEINQLIASIEIKKKDLAQFTYNKEVLINNVKSEMATTEHDKTDQNSNHVVKLANVTQLQGDIKRAQQDFKTEQEQIQSKIKNLEQELVGTEQLARDLESRT